MVVRKGFSAVTPAGDCGCNCCETCHGYAFGRQQGQSFRDFSTVENYTPIPGSGDVSWVQVGTDHYTCSGGANQETDWMAVTRIGLDYAEHWSATWYEITVALAASGTEAFISQIEWINGVNSPYFALPEEEIDELALEIDDTDPDATIVLPNLTTSTDNGSEEFRVQRIRKFSLLNRETWGVRFKIKFTVPVTVTLKDVEGSRAVDIRYCDCFPEPNINGPTVSEKSFQLTYNASELLAPWQFGPKTTTPGKAQYNTNRSDGAIQHAHVDFDFSGNPNVELSEIEHQTDLSQGWWYYTSRGNVLPFGYGQRLWPIDMPFGDFDITRRWMPALLLWIRAWPNDWPNQPIHEYIFEYRHKPFGNYRRDDTNKMCLYCGGTMHLVGGLRHSLGVLSLPPIDTIPWNFGDVPSSVRVDAIPRIPFVP